MNRTIFSAVLAVVALLGLGFAYVDSRDGDPAAVASQVGSGALEAGAGAVDAGGDALSAGAGAVSDGVESLGSDEGQTEATPTETTTETEPTAPAEPVDPNAPENLGPAGDLTNLDGWLQTSNTEFSDFDGQVKIVQFWTFGCYNCKNTIPHLQDIYATYQPEGLEIIGVHAPEFDYEADPANIAGAAVELGVTWPIALDTNKTNFRSWQESRRFWPRTYVVDANGDIRFDRIGEGDYDGLEATVAYLLANGGS